ncbi:MAG TPA: DNA/RNA non-specific endonuclease [Microscillaceae bacterium]|nr:DNA/RNA non-specific endonuclease [Microscillaceae bacterium]
MKILKNHLFVILTALLILSACQPTPKDITIDPLPQNPSEVHIALGNPSNAQADINMPTNYLIPKDEFVLAYNRDRGQANWVSWHLDNTWRGSAERQDDFRPDIEVPQEWYRVTQNDYRSSGFDQGHLCPSADRTRSTLVNSATFVMTNMIPQAPSNNRETWRQLEEYCRDLVEAGNELYIIAGGYGQGGTGSNGGVTNDIANGNVVVPSNTWKVILVLPNGNDDLVRINNNTRVIAVDMPNTQSIANDWGQYRVSVDALEQATGLDFFSLLSADIQEAIEAKVDNGPTQ